jgi:hypothetical protein
MQKRKVHINVGVKKSKLFYAIVDAFIKLREQGEDPGYLEIVQYLQTQGFKCCRETVARWHRCPAFLKEYRGRFNGENETESIYDRVLPLTAPGLRIAVSKGDVSAIRLIHDASKVSPVSTLNVNLNMSAEAVINLMEQAVKAREKKDAE